MSKYIPKNQNKLMAIKYFKIELILLNWIYNFIISTVLKTINKMVNLIIITETAIIIIALKHQITYMMIQS